MEAFTRETMSVAMEGDGLEIRLDEAGEMTVGFFRLPGGTDLRPLLHGLEGDLCQCPHWGYMLKGTLRMHTPYRTKGVPGRASGLLGAGPRSRGAGGCRVCRLLAHAGTQHGARTRQAASSRFL